MSKAYNDLRSETRVALGKLEGMVALWRRATTACALAAITLTVVSLAEILFDFNSGFGIGVLPVALQLVMGAVVAMAAVFGLRKFLTLRRRYIILSQRARALE